MKVSIEQVIHLLKQDEIVAIPTETVYGLAGSLLSLTAIEKIFTLKKRPRDNPFIVHVSSIEMAKSLLAEKHSPFFHLAEKLWPGPLSIIAEANDLIPKEARGNLPTVALRMPDHPLALEVIEKVGPLVAPSANVSGRPSSTTPCHVEQDFGKDFPVLDGGACKKGLESTILLYNNGRFYIAREGAITKEKLTHILGYEISLLQQGQLSPCPGTRYQHYSPKAKLILGITPYDGDPPVVVGFSDRKYPKANKIFSLGRSDNPKEVAENLYHILRELDRNEIDSAWVDFQFPKIQELATVAERLKRASDKSN